MHTGNSSGFKIYYLSERAVTVDFGHEISEAMLLQVTVFNTGVNSKPFPGFITSVPAYKTVSVFYDPMIVFSAKNLQGADCFEKVSNYLSSLQQFSAADQPAQQNQLNNISIPTIYNGPDIGEVAKINKISVEEVINLHSSARYKVYMLGFLPGFAYLGGLSELIETPRKATPRSVVPAGSVGIAGKQTGIYPIESPGGWQLVGKTPLVMFDAGREQPSLLQAGDEVIFRSINQHEFDHIANTRYADTRY